MQAVTKTSEILLLMLQNTFLTLFVDIAISAVKLFIIRYGNVIITQIKNVTTIAITAFLIVNRNRALNGNTHIHSRCTAIIVVTNIENE